MTKPLVLVPSCGKTVGGFPLQMVHDKYLDAVGRGGDATPLVMPAPWLSDAAAVAQLVTLADGVFLTGSPSNLEPRHYGGPELSDPYYDPHRDALTLPLIRAAIAEGVPVLGVCRGFQEMNVALGGSLHQRVHEVGYHDHRARDGELDEQYVAAHAVTLREGGVLARCLGKARTQVNSLHSQGVDRLADGCEAEAWADDGLIEALSVTTASGFALGVQWHPEWAWHDNPDSVAMFKAFGDACRAFARRRAI